MLSYHFIALLLSLGVSASPLVVDKSHITLPLTRRMNFTGESGTLAELDRARAHALKHRSRSSTIDGSSVYPVPAVNTAVTYTTEVQIGSPPTTYTLLIDTGSANTWVGAATPYSETETSVDTGDVVFVEYGSGIFIGEEFLDTVKLGENLTIYGQSIGAAILAYGFSGVDGILGIGPTDLTTDTTSAGGDVPTVTANANAQGLLAVYEVGIFYAPATSDSDPNGELTFGGADTSKFTGELHSVPITSTSPASSYVGIDQSISYGSARLPILDVTAGITDTGTTLILIASDAYNAYTVATGAVPDESTGLLSITAAQYSELESLYFTIGGVEFEFTPNAQIWPRSLNTAIGGDENSIYLVVSDIGSDLGSGLDFIDGYTFLERFYSVYSTGASSFGIATTEYTYAESN